MSVTTFDRHDLDLLRRVALTLEHLGGERDDGYFLYESQGGDPAVEAARAAAFARLDAKCVYALLRKIAALVLTPEERALAKRLGNAALRVQLLASAETPIRRQWELARASLGSDAEADALFGEYGLRLTADDDLRRPAFRTAIREYARLRALQDFGPEK
jgi:hypothetical protein